MRKCPVGDSRPVHTDMKTDNASVSGQEGLHCIRAADLLGRANSSSLSGRKASARVTKYHVIAVRMTNSTAGRYTNIENVA